MSPDRDYLSAPDEEAAAAKLLAQGRTDGLPIVVPTAERVDKMLLYAAGLASDIVLGDLGPSGGRLTVEKAAINAVMAGCEPNIFPLVIAACEALVDPQFEVGPMQLTTHCVTPLVIVNGPIREECGIRSGIGALGPGNRANATLGRAIRLIMMNVGGGNPGVGDMATLGSPAKFTCCLAEAEEESPFEPLHVSFGFGRSDSTVTLLGVEGPHSFMFTFEDFPFNEERLLQTLAAGFSNPCSNNIYFAKGMVAVALNPMHARLLAKKGLSRQDIQKKLYDYASVDRASLVAIVGNNINCSPQKGGLQHIVPSPEHILVFVAGEEGATYSAYFPTWGGGSNGQFAVTKKVRSEDLCEIPVSRR